MILFSTTVTITPVDAGKFFKPPVTREPGRWYVGATMNLNNHDDAQEALSMGAFFLFFTVETVNKRNVYDDTMNDTT